MNEVALKGFLTRQLQPICDADPDVLADYVLALLKHDKSTPDLKELCTSQLVDFLKEETEPFVDKLFKSLVSKDYLNNTATAAAVSSSHVAPSSSTPPLASSSAAVPIMSSSSSSSSSRHESEGSDDENADRNFKRSRRDTDEDGSGSRKYHKSDFHQQQFHKDNNRDGQQQHHHQQQDWDKNGRGRGGGMRSQNSRSAPYQNTRPRRGRCRDYDERGFCLRGDLCPYDHGADRIVVDDMLRKGQMPPMGMPPGGQQIPPMMMMGSRPPFLPPGMDPFAAMRSIPGFDPEKMGFPPLDPAMILTAAAAGMDPSAMIPLGGPGVPHQRMGGGGFDGGFRGRGRGRGGMGGRGGGRGGGMHGMGTRPSIDQLPQLVIDKIPLESCTIDKVNDYFKQFGNIVNIQLAIQQQQAIIEFSQITEARAAFSSPEVIFNNRFVKVYWYKPEEHQMRQQQQYPHGNQHPLNPNIYNHHQQQQPENSGEENGNNASQNDNGSSIGDSSQAEAGAAAAAPAFNVYAAMEEKKKREQDAVRNMLDIQKQKEQLIQKQIEQQKMMMQQLQKSNMSTSEKAEILKKLKELADKTRDVLSSSVTESASVKAKSAQMVASTPGAVATASSSTTSIPPSMSSSPVDGQSNIEITTSTDEDMADPVLLAQLDSLKKQAASIGITDPNTAVAAAAVPPHQQYPPFRGGRGGSFYRGGRGRGGFWARGGGGGGAPVAPRSFRLDNRPTSIMVKSDKEMGELEAHFKFFGELDKFEQAEDSSIVVKYKTRREAEAAMLKGQKLLGTDDVLNLSWHVETSGGGESVGGSNESVSVSNNGGDNLEVVADLPMEEDEAWRR